MEKKIYYDSWKGKKKETSSFSFSLFVDSKVFIIDVTAAKNIIVGKF